MRDDETGTGAANDAGSRGLSRRDALRAGVAVGVGAAAWSGASITSMGGTPAYAVACTQTIKIDLTGGCRNTDQSSSCAPPPEANFRYHTLDENLPTNFSLDNNISTEGVCCDEVSPEPYLSWTGYPNLTCVAHVEYYSNGQSNCANRNQAFLIEGYTAMGSSGAGGSGGFPIPLGCLDSPVASSTFWTLYVNCNTTGAPSDCF